MGDQTIKCSDRPLVINQGSKDYAMEMDEDANKIAVILASVDFDKVNLQIDSSSIKEKYWIKKDILSFNGQECCKRKYGWPIIINLQDHRD
jgi:hypothetical protein